MPALQSARAAALSATCKSNLRQFGVAFEIYKSEHNGVVPKPWRYQTPKIGWYDRLDRSNALSLDERWSIDRVWACPAYPFFAEWRNPANHGGHTTYAINMELQEDHDMILDAVPTPSGTYLLADGFHRAGANPWRVVSSRWDWWFSGKNADGFGFFHGSETANILYFDSHVAALTTAHVPPWPNRYQPDWNTFWTARH